MIWQTIKNSLFSPAKFETRKSFLFTESSLVMKIKNKVDFFCHALYLYYFASVLYAAAECTILIPTDGDVTECE